MKLGILSDTHNQLARCQQAVALLRAAGAEALVHCGDFTEPDILATCAVLPCYFVLGNNDALCVPELQEVAQRTGAHSLKYGDVIALDAKTVAVTHGHLGTEVRRLQALQPDYLLSGHTHSPDDCFSDGIRYINPGALHRARNFTVAVLNLKSDELTFLTVPR